MRGEDWTIDGKGTLSVTALPGGRVRIAIENQDTDTGDRGWAWVEIGPESVTRFAGILTGIVTPP